MQASRAYNLSVRASSHSRSAQAVDLAQVFAALADRTRMRLLHLMQDREVCVCYFVAVLGQSQPKISRHLAYLRRAGIVASRREGKWMHYRIAMPDPAVGILRETLAALAQDDAMQADLARFTQACCSPSRGTLLEGAPQPTQISSRCTC